MPSFLNKKGLARGIRNNNPGNLVFTKIAWQGKISKSENTDLDNHFEQFTDIVFGVRAMLKDLINDINKGRNTVSKLIHEYAPPFENDTNKYIEHVSKSLGLKPNDKITAINSSFLLLLARAIITKENGKKDGSFVRDIDIKKAISMLGNVSTPNLKVDLSTGYKVLSLIPLLLFFYTLLTVAI